MCISLSVRPTDRPSVSLSVHTVGVSISPASGCTSCLPIIQFNVVNCQTIVNHSELSIKRYMRPTNTSHLSILQRPKYHRHLWIGIRFEGSHRHRHHQWQEGGRQHLGNKWEINHTIQQTVEWIVARTDGQLDNPLLVLTIHRYRIYCYLFMISWCSSFCAPSIRKSKALTQIPSLFHISRHSGFHGV